MFFQQLSHDLIKNIVLYFTGIDYLNSVDWIRKNSTTGKQHKENSTVLCWIQSHVEKTPSIFSRNDLHYHYILQRSFPHIQAIIVDVANNSFIKHQVYNLTQYGKIQLSKCMKKPHSFDSCRTGRTYSETVNYKFYDFPSLLVDDLNCQVPNLGHEHELSQLKHIYPRDMIQQFTEVAISDRFQNGKIECLAYIAGYKDGNSLVGTHLIFPRQQGTASDVNDLGKMIFSDQNIIT